MNSAAAAPPLSGCGCPSIVSSVRPGGGGERKVSTLLEGCSAAAAAVAPSCSGNAPPLPPHHRLASLSPSRVSRRWKSKCSSNLVLSALDLASPSPSPSPVCNSAAADLAKVVRSEDNNIGRSLPWRLPRNGDGSTQQQERRRNVTCRVAAGDVTLGEGLLVPFLDEERVEHAKEWAHKSRRIVLFIEPSPFAYICGYKNRFQNFIRYLRELGDEVLIVTTDKGVPTEFYGAKVVGSWSFPCPWYENLFLSLALSPRIYRHVRAFKPDIIHASSPGIMVFGALVIAKLLRAPLVMSYHTHVPMYIPKYAWSWLVIPMWWVIRFLHRAADWTLVVSQVLGKEMRNKGAAAADRIGVWSKGVDSESFNPRFKSQAKRAELLQGRPPNAPLLVHVGRLGAEKNLDFLKEVLGELPEVHLAIVGDGPHRKELQKIFDGMNVTFTGMLTGEELSQAYASGDVFITPSETETLGFVVLEAMASGMPVVAARAGGIIDIVNREGETGYLYTPGDVHDCVAKLKPLLESSELRTKIGRAAREEVENFDWRASTRQVRNEMYSSAVWFWRLARLNRFSWLKRWNKQQRPSLAT